MRRQISEKSNPLTLASISSSKLCPRCKIHIYYYLFLQFTYISGLIRSFTGSCQCSNDSSIKRIRSALVHIYHCTKYTFFSVDGTFADVMIRARWTINLRWGTFNAQIHRLKTSGGIILLDGRATERTRTSHVHESTPSGNIMFACVRMPFAGPKYVCTYQLFYKMLS